MAVTCKNCGGAHAIWECKRPATKSTGERRRGDGCVTAPSGVKEGVPQKPSAPVDTNPPQGSKGLSDDGREVTLQRPVEGTNSPEMGSKSKSPRLGMDEVTGLGAERQVATPMTGKTKAERLGNTCGGGNTKFDKKAWSRAYMKIWMRNKRAKLKLERENAKC